MSLLTVTFQIPFDSESPTERNMAMMFTRWLPIGRENGIAIDEEDMRIVLWFDEKCTWYAHQPIADELKNYVNISAFYLSVDVQIGSLADDLLEYIQRPELSVFPDKKDDAFQLEYEKIGKKILKSVIRRVNRLIAYARSYKGQYWLKEYRIDF